MRTFTPHKGIEVILSILFISMVLGFIFVLPSEGGASGSIDFSVSPEDNIYSGPSPELGKQGKGKLIIPKKTECELHLIGNVKYFSNWNLADLNLGIFEYPKPDFCTIYFDKSLANSFPWYMYSFVSLKKPMSTGEIEDYIWEKFHQPIIGIVRIDRRPEGFVVAYIRSDHRAFDANEVSGFPYLPENLANNVNFSVSALLFKIKRVENISLYGREYYDEIFRIPFQDIFMINPTFFGDPKMIGEIIIPYSFFKKKKGFIYYYQHNRKDELEIAEKINQRIEPMVIELSQRGIRFRFYKISQDERL